MTSSLISKGFAYENLGHVYFAINSFKNYGKLSNKKLEELKAGSRIEISELKKNPMDFVLWKPSKEMNLDGNPMGTRKARLAFRMLCYE